jgi:hypothetical protein
MSLTLAPVLAASWPSALLWSSRVSALKRSVGTSGALDAAISALVLAGLPVTVTRTSSAAWSLIALPCTVKIAPFASSRSARSMPLLRGRAPTSRATLTPSNIVSASSPISTPARVRNAQSCSSITTPSSAFSAGVTSSRRSCTGVSGPSIAPEAIRNSRLYPIWPAAPVTATLTGVWLTVLSFDETAPDAGTSTVRVVTLAAGYGRPLSARAIT